MSEFALQLNVANGIVKDKWSLLQNSLLRFLRAVRPRRRQSKEEQRAEEGYEDAEMVVQCRSMLCRFRETVLYAWRPVPARETVQYAWRPELPAVVVRPFLLQVALLLLDLLTDIYLVKKIFMVDVQKTMTILPSGPSPPAATCSGRIRCRSMRI